MIYKKLQNSSMEGEKEKGKKKYKAKKRSCPPARQCIFWQVM
jgi:hypothetical protein